MPKIMKSKGAIPRGLLIFGIIIGLAIIITFVVIKIVTRPPALPPDEYEYDEDEAYEPVFEVVIKDIKFKLNEAKDRGNILRGSEGNFPGWKEPEDLTTTEKFIEVTISAENVGKENIPQGNWDIKELIDKEERIFYSLPEQEVGPWLPEENKCGVLLKPGFSPRLCTKIYEVATISTQLKVKVFYEKDKEEFEEFIDLGF